MCFDRKPAVAAPVPSYLAPPLAPFLLPEVDPVHLVPLQSLRLTPLSDHLSRRKLLCCPRSEVFEQAVLVRPYKSPVQERRQSSGRLLRKVEHERRLPHSE